MIKKETYSRIPSIDKISSILRSNPDLSFEGLVREIKKIKPEITDITARLYAYKHSHMAGLRSKHRIRLSPWTSEEDSKLIECRSSKKMSFEECSKVVGRTAKACSRRYTRILEGGSSHRSNSEMMEIKVKEVAEMSGKYPENVRNLTESDLTVSVESSKGEQWSQAEVQILKESCAAGEKQELIAKKLGRTTCAVRCKVKALKKANQLQYEQINRPDFTRARKRDLAVDAFLKEELSKTGKLPDSKTVSKKIKQLDPGLKNSTAELYASQILKLARSWADAKGDDKAVLHSEMPAIKILGEDKLKIIPFSVVEGKLRQIKIKIYNREMVFETECITIDNLDLVKASDMLLEFDKIIGLDRINNIRCIAVEYEKHLRDRWIPAIKEIEFLKGEKSRLETLADNQKIIINNIRNEKEALKDQNIVLSSEKQLLGIEINKLKSENVELNKQFEEIKKKLSKLEQEKEDSASKGLTLLFQQRKEDLVEQKNLMKEIF